MGEVRVPEQALYGAQTERAKNNFSLSTETLPWTFIEAVLIIKKAAALSNQHLGLLSQEQTDIIVEAVLTLLREQPKDQFPVSIYQTGSGTSTNMNVNEVIVGWARQNGMELSANDHVNLGQSSNDVIPSAILVAACKQLKYAYIPAFEGLVRTIQKVSTDNAEVIKTGRTHLMDALPIFFSKELSCWADQVRDCLKRVRSVLPVLQQLPLGGTAVGSGVNCHPDFAGTAIEHINQATGLSCSQAEILYKGISSLDHIVELSGILKTSAVALYKIANDLRWMNSGPLSGLAEIQLPALQPGSSIMPAKVNPVIPEAVCMACAQIIGNDTTINLCGIGGNFQLNTMLPLAAAKILESIDLLTGSAKTLADKAISGIKVNREICAKALAQNPILVTSLTPIIGYLQAAEIAKICQTENRPILEVAIERTNLPKETLEQLLDPKNLAEGGSRKME